MQHAATNPAFDASQHPSPKRNHITHHVSHTPLTKFLTLLLLLMLGVGNVWGANWTRCTKVSDLTSGGTFIIGYEAIAKSGTIVPMQNSGTATTSAAGLLYSGTSDGSSGSGTIDMAKVTETAKYEVTISASTSVDGAITIKCGSNYVGNTNTKNNLKLFASEAATTAFTPTVGTNDVFTLKINANETYHTLQYNSTSGSNRFAVYGGAQKNVVIYKKETKTLSSLTVSGTPTKTTYQAGEALDPTGLTVTGKYSDNSEETITEGIEWTLDPETLSADATTCDVMASVGQVTSDVYTVTGLTVTAAKTLIGIEATGTPAEFWKGDTFNHNGMTVTATWDDESKTDVTSESTFSTPDMTTPGEKTVTVTYKGEETSYNINVKTIANTAETAYTTAEAIALIDAGKDLTTKVYVKGTVSKVESFSDKYKSITYWLDNDTFEVYSGKGIDGADFSSINDIKVNDEVIVYGVIKKYNTTYEFNSGNYLVSYIKATTLSIADIAVKKGEDITPVITTNIVGDYTISYSSNNDNVVIASGNELVTATKTGTATITATISATGYKTAVTTFTVTVTSAATLSSITISGDLTKSTYTVGDEFDFSGLTATGNYSDETHADLTSIVAWTVEPATLTAATTKVTVKAISGEITGTKDYDITVNKKTSSITIANMEVGKTDANVPIVAETTPAEAALTYEITEGSEYITLSEGKISAVAPGTATIKASYEGNDEYAAAETTFTVTVSEQSKVTYTFSTFTSADDVTLTDLDGFTIKLSKNTGSTSPAWNTTLEEARIYAKGSLTVKANNADIKSITYTYNINANSKGVAPTIDGVAGKTTAGTWNADTKTWTGSDSEVTFSTSGSAGNIGFTQLVIKYAAGTKTETSLAWSADAATVTIDANDNVFPTLTTTPENLEGVTYESSATGVATIAEDGTITLVAPGETTITAKYAGDETHAEATPASYTLTVNEAPFVPVPVADGYETVDFTSVYSSVTSSQEVGTYKGTSFMMEFSQGSHKTSAPKYYVNGNAVRAYEGNTITITAAENIKGVVINWTADYEDTDVNITGIDTKNAVVTFAKTCRFTSITVWYKEIQVDLAITSAKWSTFIAPFEVKLTDECKAYTAKIEDKKVVFTELTDGTVPAKTPVVIYKDVTGETYTKQFVGVSEATEDTYTKDALVGVLKATSGISATVEKESVTYQNYVLQNHDNVVGFYRLDAEASLKANRCYLSIPKPEQGDVKSCFAFDDIMTGINSILAPEANAPKGIYDMNGRKLDAPQKGMNIINGVKVYIK